MINFIRYNQDFRKPIAILACAIDFSKAFNKVNHNILITKLSDMGETLKLELELIKKDTVSFLKCGCSDCITCQLTWVIERKSPFLLTLKFIFRGDIRNAARALRVYYFKKHRSTV